MGFGQIGGVEKTKENCEEQQDAVSGSGKLRRTFLHISGTLLTLLLLHHETIKDTEELIPDLRSMVESRPSSLDSSVPLNQKV